MNRADPAVERLSWLRSRATTLATAVDRRANLLLALFVAAVLATTLALADRDPLWTDELFTYYIGRLPSAGDVWSKLSTGVEQMPFFFYLVTRASLGVFGEGLLGLRLPEVLGFALMCVCLFHFVEHRSSAVYGFVAILFAVATRAYEYAYEARSYALVLGFAAAALLCWQRATEGGPHRRLAAIGMAIGLAGAIASHYYAVLILIPLLAGEAVRSLRRRRIDWLVVGSFGGALVPLLASAPLIEGAQGYYTSFWAKPRWSTVERFYPYFLLDRKLLAAVALAVVAAAFTAIRSRSRSPAARRPFRRIPDHELVALGTFVLLPLLGLLLGKLVTHGFTSRYALPAVLGVAALVALAAWWADGEAPIVGLSLVLLLVVLVAGRFTVRYDKATRDADRQTETLHFLQRHGRAGVPLLVGSPHEFFEMSHRASKDRGRPALVYLADRAEARRYLDTDDVDLALIGLEDIAPLDVEAYRPFIASHSRFLVYGDHGGWNWLTSALRDRRADLRVAARNPGGDVLFDVSLRR
jgi:uncharacterized membrane protein